MGGLYAKIGCSLPDDPKIIDAGDLAELVYIRCILRSREALSDGVIDRRLLARWTAGIRGKPVVHAQRLVDVGLWLEHPDGWQVPERAWKKWNPLAVEVQEKRDAETERKRQYRESLRGPAGVPLGQNRDDRQPEPEPEPEPFAAWWSEYPRKIAKADALKAWKGIKNPKPTVETLVAAVKPLKSVRDVQFVPYPASWLRARRWEDEPGGLNGHAPIIDPISGAVMSRFIN